MPNKTGLTMDFSSLLEGLAETESRLDAAIRAYAETGAQKLQDSARNNARWTDRTGHARQRLTGSSYPVTNGYKLALAHGVDYGIWLELANEKRYSIIPATIEKVGIQKIMPGFERLMEKLK